MKTTIQKSRLQQVIGQRNGYLVLASGLLLICLLLSIAVIRLIGREHIIVTPPVVKKAFWIEQNAVSPEYLSEMANFFAQLRLTVTPSSAEYQREVLLRYTDAPYYGTFKNILVQEAEQFTQNHISTVFYPISMRINAQKCFVIMVGDLVSTVGNVPTPSVRVSYKIQFHCENGKLLLRSFEEIDGKTHV